MLVTDRQVFGNGHRELISSLDVVSRLYYRNRDYFGSVKAQDEILEITTQMWGKTHWRTRQQKFTRDAWTFGAKLPDAEKSELNRAHAVQRNAKTLLVEQKFAAAIDAAKESAKLFEQLMGQDTPFLAGSLNYQGLACYGLNRHTEAESLFLKAADIYRGFYGDDSPDYADIQSHLGTLYRIQGSFLPAEKAFRSAIAVFEREQEDTQLREALDGLANVYMEQKKHAQAEEIYNKAVLAAARSAGSDSEVHLVALGSLSYAQVALGKLDEAEKNTRQAHEGLKLMPMASAANLARVREQLIRILTARGGRETEVLALCQEARTSPKSNGVDEYIELSLLFNESTAHLALGDYAAADTAARTYLAKAILLGNDGTGKQYVNNIVEQLIQIATYWSHAEYREDRAATGQQVIARAIGYCETHYGDTDWRTVNLRHFALGLEEYSHFNLEDRKRSDQANKTFRSAETLAAQGNYAMAFPLYQEALKTREELYSADDMGVVLWTAKLGLAHQSLGQPGLAAPLLDRAHRGFLELFGNDHAPPDLKNILVARALACEERGDFLGAIELLRDAERHLIATHASVTDKVAVQVMLATNYMELGELDRAETLARQALKLAEQQFGSDGIVPGLVYRTLLQIGERNRDDKERSNNYRKAISLLKDIPFADRPVYIAQGQRKLEEGQYDLAVGLLLAGTSGLSNVQGLRQQYFYTTGQRELAKAFFGVRRYADAEKVASEAVERQHSKFPGVEAAYQRELEVLGDTMISAEFDAIHQKRLEDAKAIAAREATFLHKLLGQDHWRTRTADNRLAIFTKVAEFDAARRDQFIKIISEFLQSPKLPPAEARQLLSRGLEELEMLIGTDNVIYHHLVYNLVSKGEIAHIDTSLRQATQALASVEKLVGRESRWSTLQLILGQLHEAKGDFESAISHSELAVNGFTESVGPTSSWTAAAHWQAGRLQLTRAEYPRAEVHLRRAHAVFSGQQSSDAYFTCMVHYGTACSHLGFVERAESLLQRAYRTAKSRTAMGDLRLPMAARALGDHYYRTKDHERAEQHYREALELYTQLGREKSDLYAVCLMGVANILRDKGDNLVPGSMYDQALSSMVAQHGEQSGLTAWVLEERGRMRLNHGDLDKARQDFDQVVAIRKRFGTLSVLPEQGDVAFQQQDRALAFKLYDQNLAVWQNAAAYFATGQGETQQLTNAQKQTELVSRLLSLDPVDGELDAVYSRILAWKGAVYSRQTRIRTLRTQPALRPLFQEWERATGALATLALHVPYPEDRDLWLMKVQDATNEHHRISTRLAAAVGTKPEEILTAAQLKELLPDKTALVDFVEYLRRVPKSGQKGKWEEERSLMAFVIRKGHPIKRIGLGSTQPAEDEIDAWLEGVTAEDIKKQASLPELAVLGQKIRQRLWEPLSSSLQDVKTLLVSPDGPLSRFPLAALPGASPDTFLAEEIGIVMLPVPSQLPRLLRTDAPSVDAPLVALGDVEYGGRSGLADARRVLTSTADGERAWLPVGFVPLENTGPEIDAVGARFSASFPNALDILIKGTNCSEQKFRELAPRARWLHLATHGFYAPELIQSMYEGTDKSSKRSPGDQPGDMKLGMRLHPGLLSGLALSGVNIPRLPEEDDGVLSAMEVASLDLSNVELAVLSACETAKGQAAGGEGVLGLQRAFQVSGAKSVVATLWPINDAATRLLMMRFYRNLWEKKMSKLEALREAQTWMLTSARAAQRAGNSPETGSLDSKELPPMLLHPSIWAPFVLSGDWR
jgi:CHAT domain-containing protein/tetratricopeptide (TPR) repeat protein